MQEVKRPQKPLIYFYVAVILAILIFNCLVAPYLARKAIKDVDYGTFMTMTERGEIGKVQIQQNQIVFTDKDESAIYRTGVIEDPGLVERLHASGATFTSEIVEETSPLTSLLLSWLMPIGIFILLGQFMSKKLMDKAGGGAGSMMFNLGKSNAKQVQIINTPPAFSWQAILKKYIGTISANKKSTRTRLNRRQPERFDLSGSVDDKVLKIVVAIDTSGSMSDQMISQIFNEIFAILAKRKHDISVIECDATVW